MENLPGQVGLDKVTSKKRILPLLKKISLMILIIVVIVVVYIATTNKSSDSISLPLFQKKPTVELKTEYQNPFAKETQYVNPFETYKNPFVINK